MFENIISILRTEAKFDYIGLWELIRHIKRLAPDQRPDIIKMQTRQLVSEMLAGGFLAIDLRPHGGYQPWADQDSEKILQRIDLAWRNLGREPNIGDIAWFTVP